MSGRMSALSNIFLYFLRWSGILGLGIHDRYLKTTPQSFSSSSFSPTLSVFWLLEAALGKFSHAYDNPHAKAQFLGDVKRLLRHRAIYPVVLIQLLGTSAPVPSRPCSSF